MRQLRKKAVIFDMDGTLVNNLQFHAKAWSAFLRKIGAPKEERLIYEGLRNSAKEFLQKELGGISEKAIWELEKEKESIYRDLYQKHIVGIDGVHAFIRALHQQGLKIGLATLGNAENVSFTLVALGIQSYFHDIKQCGDFEQGKPHPEIYVKALTSLQVSSGETLVFEDSEAGIRAARNADIDVIGITSSHKKNVLMRWGAMDAIADFTTFFTQYQLQ